KGNHGTGQTSHEPVVVQNAATEYQRVIHVLLFFSRGGLCLVRRFLLRRGSSVMELHYFHNDGFGWSCKRCEETIGAREEDTNKHSRAFREGEAESKEPQFASPTLAKWLDRERRLLICPTCGIT